MIWPFDQVDEQTYKAFQAYHRANPEIYAAFKKYAFEVRARRSRYGAKAIIERVRYEYEIERGLGKWKINNDFTSLYARLLVYNHPEFKHFFNFRQITGLRRAKSIWRKAA